MHSFERKDIDFNRETVGFQLRQAREERKLKIEAIAKKLLIQKSYLEALESGDRRKLPKGVYSRNFLREYARFLGLDHRALIDQFEKEAIKPIQAKSNLFDRRIVAKRHLVSMPAVVRNTIIVIAAIFCFVYLGFLVKKIFEPPFLVIDKPPADITVTERQLDINGRTEPESEIRINGQIVQVGGNGAFNETVYLEPGLNTIAVTAKKKYSRSTSVVRNILLQ